MTDHLARGLTEGSRLSTTKRTLAVYIFIFRLFYVLSGIAITVLISNYACAELSDGRLLAGLHYASAFLAGTMVVWPEMSDVGSIRTGYKHDIADIRPPEEHTKEGARKAFDDRNRTRQSYQQRSLPLAWARAILIHGPTPTFEDRVNSLASFYKVTNVENEVAMEVVYRRISRDARRSATNPTESAASYKRLANRLMLSYAIVNIALVLLATLQDKLAWADAMLDAALRTVAAAFFTLVSLGACMIVKQARVPESLNRQALSSIA